MMFHPSIKSIAGFVIKVIYTARGILTIAEGNFFSKKMKKNGFSFGKRGFAVENFKKLAKLSG
ncbi:MAG TPA: hypothetical protein DDZ11_04730 [Lentisphaeria bacterium]|nr:hypothetical protein [Lentisphaeria bacterium]